VARVRDVFCFECSEDPVVPSASYVFRLEDSGVDTTTFAGTNTFLTLQDDVAGTPKDMSITVNPVQGCQIRASAKFVFSAPTTVDIKGMRLQEDGTTVDASYIDLAVGLNVWTLYCQYTNMAPAPGTALTYTVDGITQTGNMSVGHAGLDTTPAVSWLEVEVIFP
jgi:hypothetical protein